MSFENKYDKAKSDFEAVLYRFADGISAPRTLKDAMLYALKSGGKRLRPVMLIEACRLFSEPDERVFKMAVAVECIHTYSLIHDDLPAMDNDDFRRGKPTVHRIFGEGMAVLAGDALLNLAYEILMALAGEGKEFVRAGAIIADACGSAGLIGGQSLDICDETPDKSAMEYIYRHKTGDLITAAITAGAAAGGADEEQFGRLRVYGENFGMAFQLTDDLLDKDEDKRSFVGMFGEQAARAAVAAGVAAAVEQAEALGADAGFFADLAKKTADRKF